MTITLNADAVNGYLFAIKNNSPIFPFYTLMDVGVCGERYKMVILFITGLTLVYNWINWINAL